MIASRSLLICLLALAAPADAAERRLALGSFERVRVDGPLEVSIATGRSPGGSVSGEARAIEELEVRLDGTTLVVRRRPGSWGERPRDGGAPTIVALTTPALTSASVVGGGRVTIDRMRGARIEAVVSGTGALAVGDVVASERVVATIVGTGAMTLGGTTPRARLTTNGPGRMDAAALRADELYVRLDGLGETLAQARYLAEITNSGLGTVTVAGSPKCTIRPGSGPVRCGQLDRD